MSLSRLKMEFKLSFWFNSEIFHPPLSGMRLHGITTILKRHEKGKKNKCTISLFIKGLCKTEKGFRPFKLFERHLCKLFCCNFVFSFNFAWKNPFVVIFCAKILLIWQKKTLQIVHTLCVKTYTVHFNRMTKSFSSSLFLCILCSSKNIGKQRIPIIHVVT